MRLPLSPFQLNIANPASGAQKQLKVEEDSKLRAFYDKRIAAEVAGDVLGDVSVHLVQKRDFSLLAHPLRLPAPSLTLSLSLCFLERRNGRATCSKLRAGMTRTASV